MRNPTRATLLASALSFALAATSFAAAPPPPAAKKAALPTFQEVDKLASEHKFEEAAKAAAAIRDEAKSLGKDEDWARALLKETQLRLGLHGYETAVKLLKDQPWPPDPTWRAVVDLYYARTLATYARAYSWEINQRERVDTKGVVDLKAWTRDQIHAEAQRAYQDVWTRREVLGTETVKKLSEFVEANTYPQGVRPTLRDAVSYLRAELLADTAGWSPEQSNEVYELDRAKLVDGDPAASSKLALDDPAVHPLLKVGAVLDDLEAWHSKAGRREAALEARLERLTRLHSAFSEAEDKAAVVAALAKALASYTDVPWWAWGAATLATFVQQDGKPDAAVRAHALALECSGKFAGSPGAKRCLHLAKAIEAPAYQLSAMAADGLGKRSIAVQHRNLPALYLRAFPYDLEKRIGEARNYNLLPNGDEMEAVLKSQKAAAEWKVELPATPDFQMHRTYSVPPVKQKGAYLVVASTRADFSATNNQLQGALLTLTDVVLVQRLLPGELELTAVAGASGMPLPGVAVSLYVYNWNSGHRLVETKTTGVEGTARFKRRDDGGGSYFAMARRGADVALDPDYLYFPWEGTPSETTSALVFTDRSVYRPGQKILWKAVGYKGRADLARWQTLPRQAVTVSLRDANWQTVETRSVVTNEFGSAAGEFLVPAGRMLGRWAVVTSLNGEGAVQVEEYKRPTFEVSLKDPDAALRLNKEATLTGEARYYFGLPVASGGARFKVVRSPVYPWWWGWWWGYGAAPSTSQIVATGTSKIEADGTFKVTFVPKADERAGETNKDLSYRYAVSVDVTDEGGETRSAERSFRLGLVSVEASISMEKGFFAETDAASLAIARTDLNGAPRPGKGGFKLFALKQPQKTLLPADQPLPRPRPGQQRTLQTPGDEVRPRHEPQYSPDQLIYEWADGEVKAQGELTHDAKGRAVASLGKLPAGAFRLRYETVDDFGAKYETFKDFVVAGPKTPLALPAYLEAEATSVPVGGTARFLVHSGLEQQLMVLDVYQAGRRVEQRLLVSGRDSDLVEIPVTEKLRGGFAVQVQALRDYQDMPQSASVMVPWDDRELKVEFASFRDRVRPGDQETFKVTVSAAAGKLETGTAELLAYMYDRSLDLFAPHVPPSAANLYPSRAYGSSTRTSLGAAHLEYLRSSFAGLPGFPSFYPDRLKFHDSYGIGGMGGRGPGGGGMLRYRTIQVIRGADSTTEADMPAAQAAAEPETTKSAERAEARMDFGAAMKVPDANAAPGQPQASAPAMRSNFSETAFWKPVLLLNPDGSASFEFTVPDSVTSWKVWVHALTRDLRGGSADRETKSVKDLMVRPYLPRFLRESDEAVLKVVVNDASDKPMTGTVTLDLIDSETNKSVLADFGLAGLKPQPFDVKPGGGANVSYTLKAPKRVGSVNVKVVASSGAVSDGELRPMPLLPSRMHLMQSRFVTLKDKEKRELFFADLAKNDDPTRVNEQLVVTLDAQLFYSVLTALPYLVNYPYECTEQTLNRFVSTGIVSSVYKDYPAVARMAEQMSKRDTPLESFAGQDPNRKIALEETPWVVESKGGTDLGYGMVNVLDPRAARAEREASLSKLRKAQTANGGFPWWPGGPPSPYMTLYILYGFAKATEFGVDVPKDLVQRAWAYLASEFHNDYAHRMIKDDCCWEFLTFLNYVASCYKDPSWTGDALTARERAQILDFGFKHWKQHSPYLKGLLSLTLKRADRLKDAQLVFASVMDSAKTTKDEGTFWAPEDRGWLWYNDNVEAHAFALRTLSELSPKDARRDGLVHWLLLNKKLNHWKSTRATAEVIYSLVHYLKAENQLAVRENAKVTIGAQQQSFVFEPDQYTGKKNQIVVPGGKLDPKTMSKVVVEKDSPGFMFASASWHFSTDQLPKEDRGDLFSVKRTFFKRVATGKEVVLQPLAEGAKLAPGDEVEIQLSLRSKHPAEYVHLRDPRAAGAEPVSANSKWRWDLGLAYYEEVRDSSTNFFFEHLPQGEYTFKYRVRAANGGSFRVGPATVQSMYAPEFGAYSSGYLMSIAPMP